jgi:hypothetical protein
MYLCERGIDSVQSLDSEWRCSCVRGVSILYKAWTYYPGFVQNQYPSHTNTSSLTIQALYRINTPHTQVHRHSLSRLCIESIPLTHKYIATHYPGLYLCVRGIDSVRSLDSEWRCTCVRGVSILYKAWIVSGDVLVCEGY